MRPQDDQQKKTRKSVEVDFREVCRSGVRAGIAIRRQIRMGMITFT